MASSVAIAGVFSDVEEGDPRSLAADEYVVVVNTGDEPVSLAGWSMTNLKTDGVHHYRYLFPRFLADGAPWVLTPGGLALVYTGRGANGGTACSGEARQYHLYQHRTESIWASPGDRVCLLDRPGRLQAAYDLPVAPRSNR